MFMASPASLGYIKMVELHDYVQFFLVVILFFVLWFYVTIILDFGDFNTKQIPTVLLKKSYMHIKARSIAHLGWLEVVWTIIPIFILTAIAIPSFKLLYALDVVNSPLLTLRCIGNQWYWTYECDIVKPKMIEHMKDNQKGILHGLNNKYWTSLHIGQNIPDNLFDMVNQRNVSPFFYRDSKMVPNIRSFVSLIATKEELESYRNMGTFEYLTYPRTFKTPKHIWRRFFEHREEWLKYFVTYGPFFKDKIGDLKKILNYPSIVGIDEFKQAYIRTSYPVIKPHTPEYDAKIPTKPFHYEFSTYDLTIDFNHAFGYKQAEHKVIHTLINLYKTYTTDVGSFAIDSYMLDADELQLGAFRLLEVDNYPILPADAEIRLAVTGTDVIHSYAVPSLGVKIDAIPGRLNQFGIRVRSPGTYYGQCSELCGVGHGFMPIKIQFTKLTI